MRVWLRIFGLVGTMVALVSFTGLGVVAVASYTPLGISYQKTRYPNTIYELDARHRYFELRLGERWTSHFGSGPAILLFPAPKPSFHPSQAPPPPSPLARFGFHWWTTQPDEASSPSFWRIPYNVGAPAWFVLALSILGCVWAVRQISRTASRVIRATRFPAAHCQGCGYDLRATPDRCPECGRTPRNLTVAQA